MTQHEFIMLTVLEAKPQKWISLARNQGVSTALFLSGGTRRGSIFSPFPASRSCCPRLQPLPSSHQLQSMETFSSCIHPNLDSPPPSFTHKDPCDCMGPTITFPTPVQLISNPSSIWILHSPWLCNRTEAQLPETDMDTSWGNSILPCPPLMIHSMYPYSSWLSSYLCSHLWSPPCILLYGYTINHYTIFPLWGYRRFAVPGQ